MIEPHKFQLFLLAALVLSLSPGPGMLYVLARTLRGGRREGMVSTLGTAVGGMVHVVAATLGLSAILLTSATAYSVLKYAGALYLFYLGCSSLWRSREPLELGTEAGAAGRAPFRQGVLTEALNPKTAVFFLTFLPQFVAPGHNTALQFLVLGTITVTLNSLADLLVAWFAAPLANWLRSRPGWRRGQQIASGSVLIGLATYLAVSSDDRAPAQ